MYTYMYMERWRERELVCFTYMMAQASSANFWGSLWAGSHSTVYLF